MRAPHLDAKIDTDSLAQAPSRNGFGEGLVEAGKRDERVVALCADLTESTRVETFAKEYPDRFIQVGVAEQNMASVASGMATMGKIPFIASYAMFSPGRNWEQIRTTVAYNNSNVKIIGAHAGVSVGPDGATHQAIEDIGLMRMIPNMVVIAPVDVHEARKAVLQAAKYDGPVYIRLGRSETPIVTTIESPFAIGQAEVFYTKDATHAKSVAIITTGTLAYEALKAAKKIEVAGLGATVLHLATIKPLDTVALEEIVANHDLIITFEEHQVAGGLGGAITEFVGGLASPKQVLRLGVKDQFGQSGEPEELLNHYGINAETIVDTAFKALL